VAEVEKTLDESADLEKRLPKYASYALAVRKVIAGARQKIEQRKLAISVRERKLACEDALSNAKGRVDAVKRPGASAEDVKAASDALVAAREELGKGVAFERRDPSYEKYVDAGKRQVSKLQEALDEQKKLVLFRSGPIAALESGLSALDTVRGTAPDEQKKLYTAALEQFRACQKDAGTMLADTPRLASQTFTFGKKKLKGSAVIASCSASAKATDAKLTAIEAIVAVYEGPAKSFEKAKTLLAEAESAADGDAKKKVYGDALAQLEECIGTGRMLEHKHPQLKKQRFDVDGRKVTLPIVIEACQKQAKSVRAKVKS
jgi:hypothetical protein